MELMKLEEFPATLKLGEQIESLVAKEDVTCMTNCDHKNFKRIY